MIEVSARGSLRMYTKLILAAVVSLFISFMLISVTDAITVPGDNGKIIVGACPVAPLEGESWDNRDPAVFMVPGNIYESNLDGTERRLLIRNGCEPVLSSDGLKVVYSTVSMDDGAGYPAADNGVAVASIDGTNSRVVDFGDTTYSGYYSLNNDSMVFLTIDTVMATYGVSSININTGVVTELISPNTAVRPILATSPDGTKIAYGSNTYDEDLGLNVNSIVIYDITSQNVVQTVVNQPDQYVSSMVWSSSSEKLLVTIFDGATDTQRLEYINADSGSRTTVSSNFHGSSVQFSPDGELIIYINGMSVYTMNIDGSDVHLVEEIDPAFGYGIRLAWNKFMSVDDNAGGSGGIKVPNTGTSMSMDSYLVVGSVIFAALFFVMLAIQGRAILSKR